MRPFVYERARSIDDAFRLAGPPNGAQAANVSPVQYVAGGTLLLDLMKLDSMRADLVVDINDLASELGQIDASADGLRLGALVRMSDAAEHGAVQRDYPVIAQSLQLAASAQLRNMASLGGNVLQRTRCQYFRDPSWAACNKRVPGSGCSALDGVNRKHAVLGVSDACISAYPGDFAQALAALDARVEIVGRSGTRTIPFTDLHRDSQTPHLETVLGPGDLITGFLVPAGPWTRRSTYLKVRDRQSYEFAIASAAVALDLDGERVRQSRIALGGLAYKPWRATDAENEISGKILDEQSARNAAEAAFSNARVHGANTFKVELGKRTLVRALLQAKELEI